MFVTKNLYQNDEPWKSTKLGFSSETIGSWGCLLTSATMMLNGIGYNETPQTVNEKMKAHGGFQDALFIPSSLPYIWPNCAYRDMKSCEKYPAPIGQIDDAVAQGKPVILQVDWSKQAGLQTHFVLVKEKKGDDYSLYDPYKYSGDGPDKEVLLTTRYKYNGAKLTTEITAVLWFDSFSYTEPEPPKVTMVPVPAENFKLFVTEDDLAFRAEPSVNGYLWKRLMMDTELICLEPSSDAKSKVGVQGQWVQVQDPSGEQGYVAAWYVSDTKGSSSSKSTSISVPTPSSAPTPSATPTQIAAPIPAGALVFYPTNQLSLRSKPVVSPETLIRYVSTSEQLFCLEPADQAIAKVGVQDQWLNVKTTTNEDGYVAAWFVKYAGGSSAQAAVPNPASPESTIKVKTTAEGVAFRNKPLISGSTVIKLVPVNYEFTIVDPNDVSKIGSNKQWVKVKDSTNEGYIAAWFVSS